MDLKVDINPEDINKAVVDAIIASSIGDAIKDAVQEKIKCLGQSYNNPLHAVVEKYVKEIIYKLLTEEYKDEIKALVREQMADKTIQTITENAFAKVFLE